MKNSISISILTALSCSAFALLNNNSKQIDDTGKNIFLLKDKSGKTISQLKSDEYGNFRISSKIEGYYTIENKSDATFKPLTIYLDTLERTYQFIQVFDYLNKVASESNKERVTAEIASMRKVTGRKPMKYLKVPSKVHSIEAESAEIDEVVVEGISIIESKDISSMDMVSDDLVAPTSKVKKSAKSGVMTAGLWNDLENWELFKTTLEENMEHWKPWGLNLINKRFSIELLDNSAERKPIIGAQIRLIDPKTDSIIWVAQTDNRGICELWSDLTAEKMNINTEYVAQWVINPENIEKLGLVSPTQDVKETFLVKPVINPNNVDISFVVDATGSMGDEINYLKEELMDLMLDIQEKLPCSNVRLSSVFYRDLTDNYVTRKTEFTENVEDVVSFVSNQSAGGGGDFPEAVDEGLKVCLEELSWSYKALAKITFLILDAPPHDEKALEIQRLAKEASKKGIKIIPVVASGINKTTEFLMKELAAITSGDYIYITDHSGVGNIHLKPTGVKENVDLLKNQFMKVIEKYTLNIDCNPENNIEREQRITVFGDQEVSLQTFPNPATNYIDVRASHTIEEISLFSISGLQISKIAYQGEQQTQRYKLNNISRGLYIVKVKVKNQIYSHKVLILGTGNSNRLD